MLRAVNLEMRSPGYGGDVGPADDGCHAGRYVEPRKYFQVPRSAQLRGKPRHFLLVSFHSDIFGPDICLQSFSLFLL